MAGAGNRGGGADRELGAFCGVVLSWAYLPLEVMPWHG